MYRVTESMEHGGNFPKIRWPNERKRDKTARDTEIVLNTTEYMSADIFEQVVIEKIERLISRLLKGDEESRKHLDVTLWCQRLLPGPQTASTVCPGWMVTPRVAPRRREPHTTTGNVSIFSGSFESPDKDLRSRSFQVFISIFIYLSHTNYLLKFPFVYISFVICRFIQRLDYTIKNRERKSVGPTNRSSGFAIRRQWLLLAEVWKQKWSFFNMEHVKEVTRLWILFFSSRKCQRLVIFFQQPSKMAVTHGSDERRAQKGSPR